MGGNYSVFRKPIDSLKNAVYTSKEVEERTDDDNDSEHSNESVEATVSSTLGSSYRQGTKRRADSSSGPSSKRAHHLTGDTDDEERVSLLEEEEDIFANLHTDDDVGLSSFGLSGDESLNRVNDNFEEDIFSLGDPTLATPSCSFEVSRSSPERSYIGSRQSTREFFKVTSTFKSKSTEFNSEAGPSGLTKPDLRLEEERLLIHDTIKPRRSATPLQKIHGRGPISQGRQSELSVKVAELSRLSSVGVKISPGRPKLKATSTPKLKQTTSPNSKQSSTKVSPRKAGQDTVDKVKTSSAIAIKASPRGNRLSNDFKLSLGSEVKKSPRRKVKTPSRWEDEASPRRKVKTSSQWEEKASPHKASKSPRRSLSKEKQSRTESLVSSEKNDGRSQSEQKSQSTGKASAPTSLIKKVSISRTKKQVESKRRSSSREDSGSEHKKVTFKSSVKKYDGDSREKLYKEQNNRRLRTRTSTVTTKLQKTGRSLKEEDSATKKDVKDKGSSPKETVKTVRRKRKGSTSPSDKSESLKNKDSPKKVVQDKSNKTSIKEPAKTRRRTGKRTASPSDKNESLKNKGSSIKNDNKESKSMLPEKQPQKKRERPFAQKMSASPSDKSGLSTKVLEASAKKNKESKKASPEVQAPRRVRRRGVKRSASPPNKDEPSKKSREVIKEYEYEVEHILGVRVTKKKGREFLIHWKGFSKSHDSWEPENNLNCTELIENYLTKE